MSENVFVEPLRLRQAYIRKCWNPICKEPLDPSHRGKIGLCRKCSTKLNGTFNYFQCKYKGKINLETNHFRCDLHNRWLGDDNCHFCVMFIKKLWETIREDEKER